jgi:hypothetical protein
MRERSCNSIRIEYVDEDSTLAIHGRLARTAMIWDQQHEPRGGRFREHQAERLIDW